MNEENALLKKVAHFFCNLFRAEIGIYRKVFSGINLYPIALIVESHIVDEVSVGHYFHSELMQGVRVAEHLNFFPLSRGNDFEKNFVVGVFSVLRIFYLLIHEAKVN